MSSEEAMQYSSVYLLDKEVIHKDYLVRMFLIIIIFFLTILFVYKICILIDIFQLAKVPSRSRVR